MQKYYSLLEMIAMIDEPNRLGCLEILKDNEELFKTVQGSTHNHQNWLGGYYDHVVEIMNIGIVLYNTLNSLRKLPFSLSDVLLITYLHDVEKPWKYEIGSDGHLQDKPAFQHKEDDHNFRFSKLKQYNIDLNDEQRNGLLYVEGELSDYSSKRRVMGQLACLCHLADVTSARLWFDHPATENDSWQGAKRIRS